MSPVRSNGVRRLAGVLLLAGLGAGNTLVAQEERRVSRPLALKAVVSKVDPVYPALARQMRMEGTVELDAVVSEAGTVAKTQIVTGNPVLGRAAEDALKRWKFTPFNQDGKPSKVVVNLSFTFKL